MKLTIGATTYNDVEFTTLWLQSVKAHLPGNMSGDVHLTIVDDGTPDLMKVTELEELCTQEGVKFVHHNENRGIPAAWNSVTRAFPETDLVYIFNNDIRVVSPDTFPAAVYFMDHNPFAAAAACPLIHVDRRSGLRQVDIDVGLPALRMVPPGHSVGLGRVGSPLGCNFFFRREAYNRTPGFWEELVSFYEEIDFGFELYKSGYPDITIAHESYVLPYPFVEHWSGFGMGGHTFQNNRELNTYKGESRMDRARKMFAVKWNCSDKTALINQNPQAEVWAKYDVHEPKLVQFLGPDGKEEEQVI